MHNSIPLEGDDLWIRCTPGDPLGSLTWMFQRPTRVTGFEIRGEGGGYFSSLRVGNEEQLVEPVPVPMTMLTNQPNGLLLPALAPGVALTLRTQGFTGEIRPLGIQVR